MALNHFTYLPESNSDRCSAGEQLNYVGLNVAQSAVEVFDVGILHGLARWNELESHAAFSAPGRRVPPATTPARFPAQMASCDPLSLPIRPNCTFPQALARGRNKPAQSRKSLPLRIAEYPEIVQNVIFPITAIVRAALANTDFGTLKFAFPGVR